LKPNNILFVFEGEVTEPAILDSLEKYFFPKTENAIIHAVFGAEIFQLAQKLQKDEFLDLPGILKEEKRVKWNSILDGYTSDDFSAIYLFFDHDGHSHTNSGELSQEEYTDMLDRMLNYFDNETDHGKLFLS